MGSADRKAPFLSRKYSSVKQENRRRQKGSELLDHIRGSRVQAPSSKTHFVTFIKIPYTLQKSMTLLKGVHLFTGTCRGFYGVQVPYFFGL